MVYEKLDSSAIVDHPDIDGITRTSAKDVTRVAGSMGNVLESVTEKTVPR